MMPDQHPHILWDTGTAYDLFASLHVLHHAENFGLRGSWAAGVRSRLSAQQRTILEQAQELFFSTPLGWVSNLPAPKDASTAIWTLSQISPAERLPALAFHLDQPTEIFEILQHVKEQRAWSETDIERMRQTHHLFKSATREELVTALNWWVHPEEFGELYLSALQAYQSVFFAEEERRIQPYLKQALEKGKEMAKKLDFSKLMIELSQGVKIAALEAAEAVVFVPSYWATPLVMYDSVVMKQWVMLFGARPADAALVPGEVIPDALLRELKALSDPTRLLILRYLRDQPRTPSQLSRKLRLRAPTVIHHLNALRLAGLVYVSMEMGEEKRYTVREAALEETFEILKKFLEVKIEP